MSGGKRRFGVSIPVELAEQLDLLAERLGVDRSRLVVEALKTYIHDHLHVLKPHKCIGVMVSMGSSNSLGRLIEEYRDIIIAYNHYHIGDKCIATLLINGESERIRGLTARLLEDKCSLRYIPLKTSIGE